MSLPANTSLALHTARSGACRSGAFRSGFVATDTQDHLTGAGTPSSSGGFFYVWAEVALPTTNWTVVR